MSAWPLSRGTGGPSGTPLVVKVTLPVGVTFVSALSALTRARSVTVSSGSEGFGRVVTEVTVGTGVTTSRRI